MPGKRSRGVEIIKLNVMIDGKVDRIRVSRFVIPEGDELRRSEWLAIYPFLSKSETLNTRTHYQDLCRSVFRTVP